MKIKFVELGELGAAIRGVTFPSGEGAPEPRPNTVACLTTSGVQDSVNWNSRRFIPDFRVSKNAQFLRTGDILISTANSKELVGKSCLVTEIPYKCTFGAFVTVFRPNEKLFPAYLAYWMRTDQFLNFCYRASSNTTNISNLRVTELLESQIPLPSLPEQQRIAALLDRADRLRRTRRYAQQLSDSFLQAVFVDMFGDPVRNTKEWERAHVSDLGNVQTGNTPPRDRAEFYGGYIDWIKSDNILDGEMYVSKSAEMLSSEGLTQGRWVGPGSLLVTCIAGSPTSIGNAALTNRRVAFNQQINAVTPHNDVSPFFLYGLFKICKPLLQRSTTLGMKRIITKSNFENLLLIKPPLALQQKFARIVHQFEQLRTQQREAERQAEHLFQTLLHQSFA